MSEIRRNVVLITGMSGAGKTSAMNILEDMGYHCIDNFPVQLLSSLGHLIREQDDKRYDNIALATNAVDYMQFLNYFENIGMTVNVVFLDASNEELLLRYRFTRRHHPMLLFSMANTLEEAIEVERDLFNRLNERAILHIDTTKLGLQELRNILFSRLSFKVKPEFTISFMSFGFKHGLPIDADIVSDVRFLPNPYYVDALKEKTGNDEEVYDYVMKFDETKEFCRRLHDYLDYVLTQYAKQKRSHLTVAIGCTGGHHRSVTIANWLYALYKDRYQCFLSHRDCEV